MMSPKGHFDPYCARVLPFERRDLSAAQLAFYYVRLCEAQRNRSYTKESFVADPDENVVMFFGQLRKELSLESLANVLCTLTSVPLCKIDWASKNTALAIVGNANDASSLLQFNGRFLMDTAGLWHATRPDEEHLLRSSCNEFVYPSLPHHPVVIQLSTKQTHTL